MKNKGNLYILITAILWSMGGILIKYIPANALAINGTRSLIAYLVFVLYLKRWKIRINKYVVSAAFCLTMTNIMFTIPSDLSIRKITITAACVEGAEPEIYRDPANPRAALSV